MTSLVSICIPAYKNTSFLERLFDSLLIQTYTNFEVIVSDDSPDDSVNDFVTTYKSRLQINYFKNTPSLGTPANWNFSMSKAKGEYIKLLHDDDWLAEPDSLQLLVSALENNPEADFVFSAYHNVQLETNSVSTVIASKEFLQLIKKDSHHLYRENIIGPPSVIMHRKRFSFYFDEKLKWVVDFEAYIRALQLGHKFVFIERPLINVGIGSLQVTKVSSRIREVEIPENLYMLNKQGLGVLNNIWVYDYYWRLFRNVNVRTTEDVRESGWILEIEKPLSRMLRWQNSITPAVLNVGIFSKALMLFSFITRRM